MCSNDINISIFACFLYASSKKKSLPLSSHCDRSMQNRSHFLTIAISSLFLHVSYSWDTHHPKPYLSTHHQKKYMGGGLISSWVLSPDTRYRVSCFPNLSQHPSTWPNSKYLPHCFQVIHPGLTLQSVDRNKYFHPKLPEALIQMKITLLFFPPLFLICIKPLHLPQME